MVLCTDLTYTEAYTPPSLTTTVQTEYEMSNTESWYIIKQRYTKNCRLFYTYVYSSLLIFHNVE